MATASLAASTSYNQSSSIPFPHLTYAHGTSRSLQEILPRLYVAFENDFIEESADDLKAPDGVPFTHIIRISVDGSANGDVALSDNAITGAQELHLSLPHVPFPPISRIPTLSEGTDFTVDSESRQLRALLLQLFIRDETPYKGVTELWQSQLMAGAYFLHASRNHVSGDPRILVTTSRGCAADALSVITCYANVTLAFNVKTCLKYFDGQEGILDVWKGAVSERGQRAIEAAANRCHWGVAFDLLPNAEH